MITICIDVGTSVIKTVAFDDVGTEIAIDEWREAGVLTEAYRRNGSQAFAGLPNDS